MSVVACKVTDKEIVVAADSILVRGYTQEKDRNKQSKLFKVNDMIIGSAGYAEESSLLRIYAKTRKPRSATEEDILTFMTEFAQWMSDRSESSSIQNTYIIIYDKKVFYMNGYYIKDIHTYEAIGAGEEIALGVLYMGHSAEDAVKAACELCIYCEEPIVTYRVSKKENRK